MEKNPAPSDLNAIEFARASYRRPGGAGILRDFDLRVRRGETVILLGRSGAGKTTALRLINRLIEPTQGEVSVESRATRDWEPISLRRRIGYVIQEGGLFPHYTVEKNIALVPRLERWPEDRIRRRVGELLELVDLPPEKFSQRYPHELSGGQRQRVGFARALAADPPILLMDEPFGALDPLTRGELQREFLRLRKLLSQTIVFVTHDVREALLLGTQVALLEAGTLRGVYSPEELLRATEPLAAAFVAAFRMGGGTP